MTKFDFSDEQVALVDGYGRHVEFSAQEALELLQWLSDKKTMLLHLTSYQATDRDDNKKEQMAIRFQPQDLVHLDTLKTAIPELHETAPATKIYVAPADTVTERAIQLLKAYRIEYKIHPMLEDDSAFAQA